MYCTAVDGWPFRYDTHNETDYYYPACFPTAEFGSRLFGETLVTRGFYFVASYACLFDGTAVNGILRTRTKAFVLAILDQISRESTD